MSSNGIVKTVSLREILEYFNLEQLTGDDESLERVVREPDVNRPGFELSGYFRISDPERILIMGNKEIEYVHHIGKDTQKARYEQILDTRGPAIIVTRNNDVPPILLEMAQARNFPILRTAEPTGRFSVDLISYLDERLAPEETVHGVLIVVYGKGVMITGGSGVGKSEAALELIRNGHMLVADDRVDILRIHNELIGTAPYLLRGMLEIRGVGIIDVERMYGATSVTNKHKIDMLVDLVPMEQDVEYDRLGDHIRNTSRILDVNVPTFALPVSPGRSTSALVESAVRNFILQEEGYNSSETFKQRLMDHLIAQNKSRGNHND